MSYIHVHTYNMMHVCLSSQQQQQQQHEQYRPMILQQYSVPVLKR